VEQNYGDHRDGAEAIDIGSVGQRIGTAGGFQSITASAEPAGKAVATRTTTE